MFPMWIVDTPIRALHTFWHLQLKWVDPLQDGFQIIVFGYSLILVVLSYLLVLLRLWGRRYVIWIEVPRASQSDKTLMGNVMWIPRCRISKLLGTLSQWYSVCTGCLCQRLHCGNAVNMHIRPKHIHNSPTPHSHHIPFADFFLQKTQRPTGKLYHQSVMYVLHAVSLVIVSL